MSILPSQRPGRVRIACVEDAGSPRNLITIPFTLDRTRPWADADALYEAMQFTWQCVPEALSESSLHALHVEVAGAQPLALEGDPAPEPEWHPVLVKAPLASIELVHYVLGYTRKLAERCLKQTPRVPLPERWATHTERVLTTLAALRGAANYPTLERELDLTCASPSAKDAGRTQHEATELCRFKTLETLATMRQRGRGPRYFKTDKHVLYSEVDLLRWLYAGMASNTSQYPTHMSAQRP